MSNGSDTASLAQSLHFWCRNAANESAMLHSALRLQIFDVLPIHNDGRAMPLDELARKVGAVERGLRSILEPMIAFEVVHMDDTRRFSLTQTTGEAIRHGATRKALEESARWFGPAGKLEEAVRSGQDVTFGGQSWDLLGHCQRTFAEVPKDLLPQAHTLWDRFARSFLRTQAVTAAVSLGVLQKLGETKLTHDALVSATGLSSKGLGVLLGMLEQMRLVRSEDGAFDLGEAKEILTPKSLEYIAGELPVSALYWDALEKLDDALRHARFALDLKDKEASKKFYTQNSKQITAVFASHLQIARNAAATLGSVKPLDGLEVMDIGTGSGVWGVAFMSSSPSLRVTFFDQEVVLAEVKKNLEKLKLLERASFFPGNLFADEFGRDKKFDVIIFPCVLDVVLPGDLPSVLQRAARALKPGGYVVINEYILNERRDGPLDHLYFAFRRYITNEGDLLSADEFRALLANAGLTAMRYFPAPTQQLIFANKGDGPFPDQLLAAPKRTAAKN